MIRNAVSVFYETTMLDRARPLLLFDKFKKPDVKKYWDDLAWYCQREIDFTPMAKFRRWKDK